MKKFLWVLLAVGGIGACTTPQEDAQIKLFWLEQMMQFLPQKAAPALLPPAAPVSEEEKPPSSLPEETVPPAKLVTPPAATTPTVAKTPRPVEAMLFLSPSCPRCQRLKRDRWISKFEDKYAGKVRLTEYDLSVPENEALLQTMMRKYHLSQVNYPTLFIAGNVVQGYPLNAEPVVNKVLSKYGWDKAGASPQQQFMEITLEDSRINKLKSNAPLKERQAMQRAIERVKLSNQQTLQDIGLMFDGDTQAQAFAIVSKSEKILLRAANASSDYKNYLNAQQKILQEQEAQLNQLMRQNAYKLRRIRG